jgi:hypothetical protein
LELHHWTANEQKILMLAAHFIAFNGLVFKELFFIQLILLTDCDSTSLRSGAIFWRPGFAYECSNALTVSYICHHIDHVMNDEDIESKL